MAAEPKLPAKIAEKYPTFTRAAVKGRRAKVNKLPAEVGLVTATHTGQANFILNALDENNSSTLDLLVNTIGSYKGATAYGLNALGKGTALEVRADGAWTITIVPPSTALELKLPARGKRRCALPGRRTRCHVEGVAQGRAQLRRAL